jgi:hypothetical protein
VNADGSSPPGPDTRALWSLAASASSGEIAGVVPVVFTQRPKPLDARHRLPYRTALVVLVLSKFNRDTASLLNLHTLMWATRTRRTRQMFLAWWTGRRLANALTARIDPDLQITLNLAMVHGLVEPTPDRRRIRLTGKGLELAMLVNGELDLLQTEKNFLELLGPLNDSKVDRQLGEVTR